MAGRILVLDDEENYAEMLQDLLRDNNYRVDMATRPERAIDQLEEIPYDLVISDYKMPVMDGADFLKKARELYPNLPFILVSGLMNTPELVKVANMGVTLVMEKPLDTEAFLQYVSRFSAPMTPEEKEAFARESESVGSREGAKLANYPAEPRFFSANSPAAKRFLNDAWAICEAESHIFILEPSGGDAELAVKDLSVWLGNSDKPLTALPFDDLISGGFAGIDAIMGQRENSSVLVVRVESMEQVSVVKQFVSKQLSRIDKSDKMLLAFLCRGEVSEGALSEAAGDTVVVVPPMVERPSDVAEYARRIVRRASERLGKSSCGEFTSETIFAILAYPWPGNYREIGEVLTKAVSSSEDKALGLSILQDALGIDSDSVPAPGARLKAMMKVAQRHYLDVMFERSGLTPVEYGEQLHLDEPVSCKDDLLNLPFIQPELTEL